MDFFDELGWFMAGQREDNQEKVATQRSGNAADVAAADVAAATPERDAEREKETTSQHHSHDHRRPGHRTRLTRLHAQDQGYYFNFNSNRFKFALNDFHHCYFDLARGPH